jgi:nitroimidazol reductase NimA-like FMN-containing flavoprotein (pyridoxamine 5'-phosphate oxidase superfamily)
MSLAALPSVIPVSYCLNEGRVLVGTGPIAQLEPMVGAVVAFEVDEFDPLQRSGWSVVITGRATEVSEDDDGDGHVIAISTEFVNGRRLLPA